MLQVARWCHLIEHSHCCRMSAECSCIITIISQPLKRNDAAAKWANALWFTIDPIRGCFCLHCCRLTAEGDKACRLVVEYTLVYVTSVNALLKRAIERGGWGPRQRSAA